MESVSNSEEPASWDELYNINLVPSELFLKFRKEIEGFRMGLNLEFRFGTFKNLADVGNTLLWYYNLFMFRKEIEGFRMGLNLEFYNAPSNDYQAKLVLKPLSPDRRWKFMYEPIHHDVRLLSKKIPLTKYLNLQVGIGHSFQLHATGWKWKLSTSLGGDGVSQIRNKTSLGLFPGFVLRFGWKAEYVLPEIHGAVGTGEPMFNMNSGKLQASLERVEAILTHTNDIY